MRMPDNKNLHLIKKIEQKSEIIYPGIYKIEPNFHKKNKYLHILWVARWEHDKNPDVFFDALKIIKEKNYDFNISVIGEQYINSPNIFNQAKEYFSDEIINYGYQDSVEKYTKILQSADLIISTANHEFYGISVIEAITAGAYPLLPDRLAYPEILQCDKFIENKRCFYDGTVNDLVNKIEIILKSHQLNPLRNKNDSLNTAIKQYSWGSQHHKIINLLTKSQK
ncbi:MAG: glycosyltransferase, partial [candidate division Zixibacteria bacterium]|nr:glycosyltransferase [candidate division Zixibacteria bacterium]